jgi:hypothetical protein
MRKVSVSTETRKRIAKFAGLAIGIAVAVLALGAWRVPTSGQTFGADLQVTATPTEQLTTSSQDPFLVRTGLRPGGPAATGSETLENVSSATLPFRVRALPTTSGLDSSLEVELSVGGRRVYNGSLAALQQWAPGGFTLRPGQQAQLDMSTTLSSTATGYDGKVVDVVLQFEPAGRSGDN